MSRINHRQLEAFRAVMVAGTVTAAAEMLRISQPAVSRLIGDLEYAVDLTLFERRKGRLMPTPEGMVLYEEVEKSFVGVDKIARTAEELRSFHRGTLRIASMPALALTFLPPLLHRFAEEHQGISISLQIRSSQKVVEWIAAQQFDIGFGALHVTDPAIEMEPLARTQLVCVLPKGHRLAGQTVVGPADLRNEVFISLLGSDLSARYFVDQAFKDVGVTRRLSIDTQLSFAACSFVQAGAGVSLVDPVTALHFAGLGLPVARFEPAIPFEYNILFPAQRPRSQLAVAFSGVLRHTLADLMQTAPPGLLEV